MRSYSDCSECLCSDCSLNDKTNRVRCDFCKKCKQNPLLKGIKVCTMQNNEKLYLDSRL